jgi:hypothetical protein
MIAIPARKPRPSFCNTVAERSASIGPEARITIHEKHHPNTRPTTAYRQQSQNGVHNDPCFMPTRGLIAAQSLASIVRKRKPCTRPKLAWVPTPSADGVP